MNYRWFLSLAAVVVADGHEECINVALEGKAFAGSVGKGGKPAFAIDGNTSDGDCYNSASPNRGHNRLMIGLKGAEVGVKYPIESVTVFAYDEQIRFARIWADRHQCGEIKRTGMDKYEMAYLDYGGCDNGECDYGGCEYGECDPNPYPNACCNPNPNPYLNRILNHTLTLTLTHTRTHTVTHALTHSLTHTLTHTLIHTLTYTLTHTLTLILP